MRRWLLFLLFAFGCSSSTDTLFGNSSGGAAKVCAPGHQVTCGCPGGVASVQVCLSDGTGYAGCQCGSSSSGAGGMSTSSSSGVGGMSTSSSSGVGGAGGAPPAPCVKQSDCNALADACHVGTCVNGVCEKEPASDGASCDDGQFCTVGDHCQAGVCGGGTPKACPGGSDPCHVAVCDAQKQACALAPGNDGAACDDENPCTGDGACNAGNCLAGVPISCAQLDTACTVGVCNPMLGCQSKPKSNGTPCDDMKGNPCTAGACTNGQCQSLAANEGKACDDGLFCTDADVCAGGTCKGAPKVCPPPANICYVGACDEVNKTCGTAAGNDGTFCNNNNVCTAAEKCSAGTCGGGSPVNGALCNDGNACTANDKCGGGACAGTPIVACANGDGCCPAGCTKATDNDCACGDFALSAIASVSPGSGSSPPYEPKAMNDGIGKTCSGWAWVGNSQLPSGAWAELDWPSPVTIGSIYVETENATVPLCGSTGRNIASATLQYWNGATWVTSTQWSGQPADIKLDLPAPVVTTKLRMFDMTTAAAGANSIIWEWHVYQPKGCVPPP